MRLGPTFSAQTRGHRSRNRSTTGLSLAQIDGGLRRNNLLLTDFADEISILIDEVVAKGSPGLRIDGQLLLGLFSLPNVSFPK